MPISDDPISHDFADPAEPPTRSRRHFLLIGLGLVLTGCGPQKVTSTNRSMPGPVWRPRETQQARTYQPPPRPTPTPTPQTPSVAGVLPRNQWASGNPVPARMNRMTPINCITVHHDGMSPFYDADERNTINRIESIRRFHRDRNNWGDIGYHYVIDRSGRVWEGRPIGFQGAHVGNHNEGNIGVLLLGNFDQQSPSDRQLDALNTHLSRLMRSHRVPLNRVATHREWDGARTVCPGATLQTHMDNARRRGWLG